MPDVAEVLEQCKWLISKGRGGEAAKLLLPRVAARKRIANAEKRRRITLVTDEQNFSEFHAIKEAWMLEPGMHENPTRCVEGMIEAMRQFDIRGWLESRESAT